MVVFPFLAYRWQHSYTRVLFKTEMPELFLKNHSVCVEIENQSSLAKYGKYCGNSTCNAVMSQLFLNMVWGQKALFISYAKTFVSSRKQTASPSLHNVLERQMKQYYLLKSVRKVWLVRLVFM